MTVCGFISLYLILYFTLKLKLPKQYTCIITLIWKKNQRFMVKNKFSTVFEDIEGKQVKEKKLRRGKLQETDPVKQCAYVYGLCRCQMIISEE